MDGLLLRIAYDLVYDLHRNGLDVGRMRLQHVPKGSVGGRKFRYSTYASGNGFLSALSEAMSSPRYLCMSGDYPLVVNLDATNTNVSFHNSYKWVDLFGRFSMSSTVGLDVQRSARRDEVVDRYVGYQRERLLRYVSDSSAAMAVRSASYVDPCYVDAGYVSPNADPVEV